MSENGLLVLEQQYYRLAQLDRANDVLDSKAMNLLQIATGILILTGLLAPGTLLFFIPFGLVAILSAHMISPKDTYAPGPSDWETIDREYIELEDDCLLQVLSDCIEAADKLSMINERKSKTVKWLFVIFAIQTVLFVTVLFVGGL